MMRVTFDGQTVDLVDCDLVESPQYGPMLTGHEPATGRSHRISIDLVDTLVEVPHG